MLQEYDLLINGNEIFQHRLKGTSIVPLETLASLGVSGPVLRASGIPYDLRKKKPYSIYDRFDFRHSDGNDGGQLGSLLCARAGNFPERQDDQTGARRRFRKGRSWPKRRKLSNRRLARSIMPMRRCAASWASMSSATAVRNPTGCIYAVRHFYNLGSVDDVEPGHEDFADFVAVMAVLDPCMGEADA